MLSGNDLLLSNSNKEFFSKTDKFIAKLNASFLSYPLFYKKFWVMDNILVYIILKEKNLGISYSISFFSTSTSISRIIPYMYSILRLLYFSIAYCVFFCFQCKYFFRDTDFIIQLTLNVFHF